MVGQNLTTFNGKPVQDYTTGNPIAPGTCYRLRLDWDAYENGGNLAEMLTAFLENPAAGELTELVIGNYAPECDNDSSALAAVLVASAAKLPKLEALFFGDITYEEQEISWIQQCELGPLLQAYPLLETVVVRGGSGLGLDIGRHPSLRSLTVQTGGLPASVLAQIAASDLPRLTHLELWLGTDDYGGDATVEDVAALVDGKHPNLTFLGLMDSEMADELATALANWTLPESLETLDLSMGTMTDAGADALLAQQRLAHLKRLNLRHHFMSDTKMQAVADAFPNADLSDQQQADVYDDEVYRYVEVAE
jgi:hypothetical protein